MILIICIAILDELSSELVHTLRILAQLSASLGSHELRLRVYLRRVEFFLTLLEHPTLPSINLYIAILVAFAGEFFGHSSKNGVTASLTIIPL